MPTQPELPELDVGRILRTLDAHGVEYMLVGGAAAIAHGAQRPTFDLDCVPRRNVENLERLAAAMRELNARLRVEGLDDAEASRLPVQLDGDTLGRLEISTWRTDAGDLDVLADIPDRQGRHVPFEELIERAGVARIGDIVVRVAALDDVIASKEWADRPKDRRALRELRELRDQQH